MAGLALFIVSSIAAAFATTAGVLIVARVFQALGACGAALLGRAMVRDGTSTENAAGAMAALGVALTLIAIFHFCLYNNYLESNV